ncbi:MAG: thiolase family protein [Desulfobacterales bacterium]
MRDTAVIGVGMTRFGKYMDKTLNDLVHEAVCAALSDAGVKKKHIEAAYVGNAVGGLMTGQEMIRGHVALSTMGIDSIPIYNVESACASSSSAFNLGWTAVSAGIHDCVLVVGCEKLFDRDKHKSFEALGTAIDLVNGMDYFKKAEAQSTSGDKIISDGVGKQRSIFMDMYAFLIKDYMRTYGFNRHHFAQICVKSHKNGALNPHAQYQKGVSVEDVLNSGEVVYPLTRMMCSPIGDGAAAAVICSKKTASRFTTKPIWVAGSVLGSGKITFDTGDSVTRRLVPKIYASAGIGPEDIDVVEVHDATSPSEIMFLIELGLCPEDEAVRWIETGELELDGRMPSNPSGGLASKGHPIGATGAAMIFEIVMQLRGEAGKRQVLNAPKVGMTHNGGGILGIDAASMALHIFKR